MSLLLSKCELSETAHTLNLLCEKRGNSPFTAYFSLMFAHIHGLLISFFSLRFPIYRRSDGYFICFQKFDNWLHVYLTLTVDRCCASFLLSYK